MVFITSPQQSKYSDSLTFTYFFKSFFFLSLSRSCSRSCSLSLSLALSLLAYAALCSQLAVPSFLGADSFYVRVNLDINPSGDAPFLGARCDDIMHVTDTRYMGKYQWRCRLLDRCTAQPLQAGTMPNYNR